MNYKVWQKKKKICIEDNANKESTSEQFKSGGKVEISPHPKYKLFGVSGKEQ